MMGKREKGDGKMISYSNLLYFLELSDTLSFTKAARKLLISQQALSGTISAMEKELGVVLFQRTTPLQPTYAGRVLQKYAMCCWRLACPTRWRTGRCGCLSASTIRKKK